MELQTWEWGRRGQARSVAATTIALRRVMCPGMHPQGSWDDRPRLVRLAAILGAVIQYRDRVTL